MRKEEGSIVYSILMADAVKKALQEAPIKMLGMSAIDQLSELVE